MEIINTTGNDIKKYRDENVSRFILGEKSLNDWNAYVEGLKKLGLDKVTNLYRTAYERAQKNAAK